MLIKKSLFRSASRFLSLKSISRPWLFDFLRICFLAMVLMAYHWSLPSSVFFNLLITALT